MRSIHSTFLFLAGLALMPAVHAFDRGSYTFDNLEKLWRTSAPNLGSGQKPYEFFTKVIATPNGADVPPPFCDSDDEFEQSLCEAAKDQIQTQPTGPDEPSRTFAVFPLSSPEASSLYPRLIGLQRYLNRHDEYQVYHAERLDLIKQNALKRQRQAALAELFLAHVRLYYADSTLSSKCTRMKRAREYMIGLGSHPKDPAILSVVQPHVQDAMNRLSDRVLNEVREPIVCRLISIQNRASEKDALLRLTSSKLREAIEEELRLKQSAIENAAKPIQDLNNRLQGRGDNGGIPLLTDEIFKLELDVTRAGGNMSLVANDKYRLQSIADSSKTKPEDAAGSKIPVQIEKAIKDGPEKLNYAKDRIAGSFQIYVGTLRNFLDYIKARKTELCQPGSRNCPQRCEALAKYDQTGFRLEDRLKPLDPAAHQGNKAQDPKEFLLQLKTDLDSCLDDISLLFDNSQELAPAEQYQLMFSKDMNAFYPSMLR